MPAAVILPDGSIALSATGTVLLGDPCTCCGPPPGPCCSDPDVLIAAGDAFKINMVDTPKLEGSASGFINFSVDGPPGSNAFITDFIIAHTDPDGNGFFDPVADSLGASCGSPRWNRQSSFEDINPPPPAVPVSTKREFGLVGAVLDTRTKKMRITFDGSSYSQIDTTSFFFGGTAELRTSLSMTIVIEVDLENKTVSLVNSLIAGSSTVFPAAGGGISFAVNEIAHAEIATSVVVVDQAGNGTIDLAWQIAPGGSQLTQKPVTINGSNPGGLSGDAVLRFTGSGSASLTLSNMTLCPVQPSPPPPPCCNDGITVCAVNDLEHNDNNMRGRYSSNLTHTVWGSPNPPGFFPSCGPQIAIVISGDAGTATFDTAPSFTGSGNPICELYEPQGVIGNIADFAPDQLDTANCGFIQNAPHQTRTQFSSNFTNDMLGYRNGFNGDHGAAFQMVFDMPEQTDLFSGNQLFARVSFVNGVLAFAFKYNGNNSIFMNVLQPELAPGVSNPGSWIELPTTGSGSGSFGIQSDRPIDFNSRTINYALAIQTTLPTGGAPCNLLPTSLQVAYNIDVLIGPKVDSRQQPYVGRTVHQIRGFMSMFLDHQFVSCAAPLLAGGTPIRTRGCSGCSDNATGGLTI